MYRLFFHHLIFMMISCTALYPGSVTAELPFLNNLQEKWSGLDKRQKLLYTNIGGALLITAWGVGQWDYGSQSPHVESEEWFDRDTKSGGADKLGHLYSAYIMSHGLTHIYRSWGYPKKQAAYYGALSSFGLTGFMEVGDSFSDIGFSTEDLVMNAIGSFVGYHLYTNPDLAKKYDLRVDYRPTFKEADFVTDYERMKFLLAVKLDGFPVVKNKYLKYLEFHLGYYTRGYVGDLSVNRERNVYAGIGINLSKIFSERSYKKTATFFKYYQMPYSYIEFSDNLD